MGINLIAKRGKTELDLGRSYKFKDIQENCWENPLEYLGQIDHSIHLSEKEIFTTVKTLLTIILGKGPKWESILEELQYTIDELEENIRLLERISLLVLLKDEKFTFKEE